MTDDTQLINTGLIAELAGVLPTHELAAMLARFAEDLVHKHTQLEDALEHHDCKAICRIAHSMTGTCGTFGAVRLSEQCRELLEICEDYAARTADDGKHACPADIEARVGDINQLIDDTLKALEAALLAQGA